MPFYKKTYLLCSTQYLKVVFFRIFCYNKSIKGSEIMEYITNNEIAVNNLNSALAIQEVLLQNNYVVMLSKEGPLYIINYIWSEDCDRNDVIFLNR